MTKLYYHGGQWQVPGQQSRDARRHDVPAKPAELAAWLNSRGISVLEPNAVLEVPAGLPLGEYEIIGRSTDLARDRLRKEAAERCPNCKQTPAAAELHARQDRLEHVLAWLDQATPGHVEQLFAALGARFHEAAKGRRHE